MSKCTECKHSKIYYIYYSIVYYKVYAVTISVSVHTAMSAAYGSIHTYTNISVSISKVLKTCTFRNQEGGELIGT